MLGGHLLLGYDLAAAAGSMKREGRLPVAMLGGHLLLGDDRPLLAMLYVFARLVETIQARFRISTRTMASGHVEILVAGPMVESLVDLVVGSRLRRLITCSC
jgi:hypothetical protein